MNYLFWMHDPRLKSLAFSAFPAWLWSLDAHRVLWANPLGALIFGAPSAVALAGRVFDGGQPAAAQVERLALTLPADETPRLERLRGFGGGLGRTLTCSCSRLTLADGTLAVLIAAAEPSARAMPLPERATRLLAGIDDALAAFAEDGTLISTTPAARSHIGSTTSLAQLRAGTQVATHSDTAIENGFAKLSIERIGNDSEAVWLVSFGVAEASVPDDGVEAKTNATAELSPSPPADTAEPRRLPLRFVWHMDAESRFTVDSREFVEWMGPASATLLGLPWPAIAAAMQLDPDGRVAAMINTRDSWSGVTVAWPVHGSDERITVELSGLPVYDREHVFRGYRGFGMCREVERLNAAQADRVMTAASDAATEAPASSPALLPPAQASEHVVPLRPSPGEVETPRLSPRERHAFDELSRRLAGRISASDISDAPEHFVAEAVPNPRHAEFTAILDSSAETGDLIKPDARPFLDRLPVGVLVYRLNSLLYANTAFLDWAGFDNLDALTDAGGLDCLLIDPPAGPECGDKSFSLANPRDPTDTVRAQLLQVPWHDETAFAVITMPTQAEVTARASAAIDEARAQVDELNAILDTATDGVIVLDRAARILSSNRSAQALFGCDAQELAGRSFNTLFTPESVGIAADYLRRLQGTGVASLLNDGREIVGRERGGGAIPLFMTIGRLGEQGEKFCAVFRDVTPWKKVEQELTAARREAERASSAKSDFLAKVSREIRTPLDGIIGFSEAMLEERFDAIGNTRYRQYLKDIRASGEHLIAFVNDLLELAKIEAGKLELTFASVSLNDLTQQCVATMQQQASRERIIIRTSLSPKLPPVTADARSLHQIVLNVLSNSIKFTAPGGQVIVSTAMTDTADVVLRVRDTGIGMRAQDIATTREPFRQVATTSSAHFDGTTLGLALAKALAQANHASFRIKNTPNTGTLVEITFPPTRVLAEQS